MVPPKKNKEKKKTNKKGRNRSWYRRLFEETKYYPLEEYTNTTLFLGSLPETNQVESSVSVGAPVQSPTPRIHPVPQDPSIFINYGRRNRFTRNMIRTVNHL